LGFSEGAFEIGFEGMMNLLNDKNKNPIAKSARS
jgi:hypothetical protein